ncbi:MAG: GNAT family N-acetyltransferase [Ignavibacteria bacterium]|nr:GNAT family N-acetyltransferase [Ignavibacteria bacterium]
MIRALIQDDREKIICILKDTRNFSDDEINIAVELIDVYLNNPGQNDYEIFVDEEIKIRGYVCIGPRPLTEGTYDLYWIAVNPSVQSSGIGSGLINFIEDHLKSKNGRLVLIETSGKESYEKERRFYEKNNYMLLVNIKDFYKPGDDLIVYGKYLK